MLFLSHPHVHAASMPPAPGPFSGLRSLGANNSSGGGEELPRWVKEGEPGSFFPSKYPKSYYLPTPWASTDTPQYKGTGLPGTLAPYHNLLNPSPYLPITSVTRDPWWYDSLGLRPYGYIPRSVLMYPSALRNSYLSPIRNSYVWSQHPLREL